MQRQDQPQNELKLQDNPLLNESGEYELDLSDEEKEGLFDANGQFRFWAFGCAGTGKDEQEDVAEFMEYLYANCAQNKKPIFGVNLGDLIYNSGANSATDPLFQSGFHKFYKNGKLPFFLILGNHDWALHKQTGGVSEGNCDPNKGIAQIQHTFLPHAGKSAEEMERMFKGKKLKLADLPKWTMPRRYYSVKIKGDKEGCDLLLMHQLPSSFESIPGNSSSAYLVTMDGLFYVNKEKKSFDKIDISADLKKKFIAKLKPSMQARVLTPAELKKIEIITGHSRKKDVEMFFLDASLYAQDFLRSLEGDARPGNQAKWFEAAAKRNPDTIKFLFLHQPTDPLDKRVLPNHSDIGIYLTKEEIAKLEKLGIKSHNYNDILAGIFRLQGLSNLFDAEFCAHTHALAYKKSECEIVSMATPPTPASLAALPMQAAYIFTPTGLFYVNKANKEILEIPLTAQTKKELSEANLTPDAKSRILSQKELDEMTLITGHTHKNKCQILSGGGGGELQHRYNFSPTIASYMEHTGIVEVAVNPSHPQKEVTFDLRTTQSVPKNGMEVKEEKYKEHYHVRFNNLSAEPIRESETETLVVERLRNIFLAACNDYLSHISTVPQGGVLAYLAQHKLIKNPNSHGEDGVIRVDDIRNFMNSVEPIDFEKAISFLKEKMQGTKPEKKNSLGWYVDFHMKNSVGLSYKEITDTPNLFSQAVLGWRSEQAKAASAPISIAGKKPGERTLLNFSPISSPEQVEDPLTKLDSPRDLDFCPSSPEG